MFDYFFKLFIGRQIITVRFGNLRILLTDICRITPEQGPEDHGNRNN